MKATFYGHSCIELSGNGIVVLFDPYVSPNPKAQHIQLNEIIPDYIFLSHCHGDHVADMASIQAQSGAKIVSIVETGPWVERQGVDPSKITAMNIGGTIATSFGSAKMVPALHTNSTPDGDYAGIPAGYVLHFGDKNIYFAGDTALSVEMQLLADAQLDIAFLPIGGFFTMDVADAIKAAKMIACKHIIGIHYGTFPPIAIDEVAAKEEFKKAGLNLQLLKIGESIDL